MILIQADEGPIPERDPERAWQDATDEELRIKFGILNAFYFPGRGLSPAPAGHLAGQQLPRDLRRRSSASTCPSCPTGCSPSRTTASIYDFHDVTDRVRCGGPADDLRTARREYAH